VVGREVVTGRLGGEGRRVIGVEEGGHRHRHLQEVIEVVGEAEGIAIVTMTDSMIGARIGRGAIHRAGARRDGGGVRATRVAAGLHHLGAERRVRREVEAVAAAVVGGDAVQATQVTAVAIVVRAGIEGEEGAES